MRYRQPKLASKSQRWMQEAVNANHEELDRRVAEAFRWPAGETLSWVSPLVTDDYAEYRDEGFLNRLGLTNLHVPLRSFWPKMGPQWDGLARTSSGKILLVEAKAHIGEGIPDRSKAKSTASIRQISEALAQAKAAFRASEAASWEVPYFQYANRLAHLHYLRELNHVDAHLLFLYFADAPDTTASERTSSAEWIGATRAFQAGLGLPRQHPYVPFVRTVIWSVQDMGAAA